MEQLLATADYNISCKNWNNCLHLLCHHLFIIYAIIFFLVSPFFLALFMTSMLFVICHHILLIKFHVFSAASLEYKEGGKMYNAAGLSRGVSNSYLQLVGRKVPIDPGCHHTAHGARWRRLILDCNFDNLFNSPCDEGKVWGEVIRKIYE